MSDEIREIVKEIECYRNEELCLIFLSRKESNALLDYITNLQQENKRLKETLEEHDETLEKTFDLVAQLSLRIDKTINILNNIFMLDNVTITNNACEEIYKAINILQNGSDSQ